MSTPVAPEQITPDGKRRRAVDIDLTGSNCGPDFLAVVAVVCTDWPDAKIREEAARYYGVPLEQVGWPRQPDEGDDPYGD
jgi:hypothetical protein